MKTTVTESDFHNAFRDIRQDDFSYAALSKLYEWFEQYEVDCGEEIELDVIAICRDFSEMTLEEINQDYGREYKSLDDAIEDLQDETTVIPVDDETAIIQAF